MSSCAPIVCDRQVVTPASRSHKTIKFNYAINKRRVLDVVNAGTRKAKLNYNNSEYWKTIGQTRLVGGETGMQNSNVMGLGNLPMAFRTESALVANVVTYINVYVHGAHARTHVSSRVPPNEQWVRRVALPSRAACSFVRSPIASGPRTIVPS